MTEPIKLVLSGEMREHLIAINEAANAERYPAYAVSVTFVIDADSPEAAKSVLYDLTEHLHEESEFRSIYYGDEVKTCEVDEFGDVFSDSI